MANKKTGAAPEDAVEVGEPGETDMKAASEPEPAEQTRALDAQPPLDAPPARETAARTATPVFDESQTCTTISPQVVIRGKIRSEENLIVSGRIEAAIRSTQDIRLETTGIINANVDVRSIWIAGIVVGDIRASQLVELSPGARVVGNIQAARLVVKDGAKFRGRIEMEGLSALEAIKPASVSAKKGKTPAVAEVIWSDVEDLAPSPARAASSAAPRVTEAKPGPAQVPVTPRVRQPPAAAPARPAPAAAPAAPAAPPAAASADKQQPQTDDKGIGSWFRRQ